MGERMTLEQIQSSAGFGHRFRYHLASGFADDSSSVLDVACGIGYGSDYFVRHGSTYIGVDKRKVDDELVLHDLKTFIQADLATWNPNFRFDVGVSFETIEHLDDYSNLISVLKQAEEWIIVSVPVVPTVHMNPWHKHDFKPGELVSFFVDDDWEHFQTVEQKSELSEIYVFKRRGIYG